LCEMWRNLSSRLDHLHLEISDVKNLLKAHKKDVTEVIDSAFQKNHRINEQGDKILHKVRDAILSGFEEVKYIEEVVGQLDGMLTCLIEKKKIESLTSEEKYQFSTDSENIKKINNTYRNCRTKLNGIARNILYTYYADKNLPKYPSSCTEEDLNAWRTPMQEASLPSTDDDWNEVLVSECSLQILHKEKIKDTPSNRAYLIAVFQHLSQGLYLTECSDDFKNDYLQRNERLTAEQPASDVDDED